MLSIAAFAKDVFIEWETIPNAKHYEINIFNSEFNKVLKTNESIIKLPLEPQHYEFKIRAVDKRGVPTAWSPSEKLTVPHDPMETSYLIDKENNEVTIKVSSSLTQLKVNEKEFNSNTHSDLLTPGVNVFKVGGNLNGVPYTDKYLKIEYKVQNKPIDKINYFDSKFSWDKTDPQEYYEIIQDGKSKEINDNFIYQSKSKPFKVIRKNRNPYIEPSTALTYNPEQHRFDSFVYGRHSFFVEMGLNTVKYENINYQQNFQVVTENKTSTGVIGYRYSGVVLFEPYLGITSNNIDSEKFMLSKYGVSLSYRVLYQPNYQTHLGFKVSNEEDVLIGKYSNTVLSNQYTMVDLRHRYFFSDKNALGFNANLAPSKMTTMEVVWNRRLDHNMIITPTVGVETKTIETQNNNAFFLKIKLFYELQD